MLLESTHFLRNHSWNPEWSFPDKTTKSYGEELQPNTFISRTDEGSRGRAGSQPRIDISETPIATADESSVDLVGPYWPPDLLEVV